MLPLAGGCTVIEPVPGVNVSGTNRWFSLNACVADPSAISETDATRAASGVGRQTRCRIAATAGS